MATVQVVVQAVSVNGDETADIDVSVTVGHPNPAVILPTPVISFNAPNWVVQFDSNAITLDLTITPRPKGGAAASKFWEMSGTFINHPIHGVIARVSPGFEVTAVSVPLQSRVVARLSPLRDVTESMRAILDAALVTNGLTGVPVWGQSSISGNKFLTEAWAPPSPLDFEARTGSWGVDNRILEFKGVDAPQLFAVCWPDGVDPAHIPFIVFIHPSLGQTDDDRKAWAPRVYPTDPNYLSILHRYTHYIDTAPPENAGPKGLPLQIAAARKKAVLIVPLLRFRMTNANQLGDFVRPPVSAQMLGSILDFMVNQKGLSLPWGSGRMGLAAFSAGNDFMHQFMQNHENANHPIFLDLLQEVYSFDPIADGTFMRIEETVRRVNAWRQAKKRKPSHTANNQDRVVRIYAQSPSNSTVVDGGTWAAGGNNDFTTLALNPPDTWEPWNAQMRGLPKGQVLRRIMHAHQLIPMAMMRHAMRVSDFPVGGVP